MDLQLSWREKVREWELSHDYFPAYVTLTWRFVAVLMIPLHWATNYFSVLALSECGL